MKMSQKPAKNSYVLLLIPTRLLSLIFSKGAFEDVLPILLVFDAKSRESCIE